MSNVAKLEAQILEALDRTEKRSTRESGIQSLTELISRDNKKHHVFLKLVFCERNRNIWKVLLEPVIVGLFTNHTSTKLGDPPDFLPSLLKALVGCMPEESCHSKCTELVERLYRDSKDGYVLDFIVESIPYSRSQGLAICLLNIARSVVEMEIHAEKFTRLLFQLHTDSRNRFLYTEWILCLSELISQRNVQSFSEHSPELTKISQECARILLSESRQVHLTRNVAMACCVYLSVVPRVSPEPSLRPIATAILGSLSRANLQLFALTRCFPKLRSTIAAAHAAWMPLATPNSPDRNPIRQPSKTTAETVRSRVIESVTNLSSPERVPPVPTKEVLYDQEDPGKENSFLLDSEQIQTTTRWDLVDDGAENSLSTQIFPPSPKPIHRPSFNSEFQYLIESGNEDDLVEFLFVHDPLWSALIDDENVVLLFHLIVELIRESSDCPSVLERLFDYLDACDERVARLVNKEDIIELRDILVHSLDDTLLTPSLRTRTRKILRCFYGQ